MPTFQNQMKKRKKRVVKTNPFKFSRNPVSTCKEKEKVPRMHVGNGSSRWSLRCGPVCVSYLADTAAFSTHKIRQGRKRKTNKDLKI